MNTNYYCPDIFLPGASSYHLTYFECRHWCHIIFSGHSCSIQSMINMYYKSGMNHNNLTHQNINRPRKNESGSNKQQTEVQPSFRTEINPYLTRTTRAVSQNNFSCNNILRYLSHTLRLWLAYMRTSLTKCLPEVHWRPHHLWRLDGFVGLL